MSRNGERRQVERRWLKSKLIVRKQICDSIKQKVTNHADKAKQAYYSAKVQSSTTCKQLFQNFNTILSKNISSLFLHLLTHTTSRISFLTTSPRKSATSKTVCLLLALILLLAPTACPDTSFTGNPLLTFEPVTDD